jgi:hyperosmotically inducible periplasmic protein
LRSVAAPRKEEDIVGVSRPKSVVSSLVVLCLLAGLTQVALAAGKYDEQIEQDVLKQIQSKSQYQGVKATTEDGIVTLDGTVNLYIDQVNLEKKAKKIKNVDAVRNHIQVQSNVPDDRLRENLADQLRYDRVGQGIAFNAITLDVQNGVVTLGGNVHDYPSRDSALAIAETTPGVKDVIDNLEVAPNSIFDDQLRLQLYRAIYRNPPLQRYALDPQKPIRIIVDNGHVTLYGVVDSAMDKQLAGTQANSVPGVFRVDNQLLVMGQQNK